MFQIAPEKLAIYRATAQKQQARKREQLLQRQAQGRAIAQQAADLLKTQFGATRVILFGSLLQVEQMHSQVDL
jgi:predicted nucleotidyltransferase